ncbi:MAG: hypothetical protein AAFV77_09690, partial [Planctomycetota bacterium]
MIASVRSATPLSARRTSSRLEVAVALQQRELAIAQLERAQRRFDAQRVPEIEVLRAESGDDDRLGTIRHAALG